MGDIVSKLREKSEVVPFANQGEIEYRRSLHHEAADHITSLQKRIEVLEGALAPFSEAAEVWPDEWSDTANNMAMIQFVMDLNAGHFRRARAALQEE